MDSPDWRDTEAGLEVRAASADYQEPGRMDCPECLGAGSREWPLPCPCHDSIICPQHRMAEAGCGRCEETGWLPACPGCGEEPSGDAGGSLLGEECSFKRRRK